MKEAFSIQFVSKVTGINAHTIRAWEKRYKAVVPERMPHGKRLYSGADIERLKVLSALVSLGSAISDIASLSSKKLEELLQEYGQSSKKVTRKEEKVDFTEVLNNLILALNHYKLDILSHELDKLKNKLGPRDFAFEILYPLLMIVGDRVNNGKFSVAQEHALSAILKFHIGHLLYQQIGQQSNMTYNVCIATPEGELHEFGIMIAALLCCHYNINFYYLGADLPAQSLAEAANQIGSKFIILGSSRSFATEQSKKLETYVSKLKEILNPKVQLWVGGVSKLSKNIEADFIPTLEKLDEKLANYNN